MWGSKKPKQKQYSGWPGDCSEEQLKALDDFREFVRQLNGGTLDPQWDDHYLLRFLRARKFNKEETQKMWTNFINWRKKNNIDKITAFKFPQLPDIRKEYPHGYHKTDKLGRPIYIERVGFLNVDQIFKITNQQRLLQYYALSYETLLTTIFDACTEFRKKSTGQDKRICQTLTILDLKNVKLGSANKAYNFVKPASAMAQDNYPQILGNMFIINAPMLFTGIWAIVKMWIDQKTKEKIKILGSSYKKELLQFVEPQNLPAFLDGGQSQCQSSDLTRNIGPWNPEGKQLFPSCFEGYDQSKKEAIEQIEKAQQKLDQMKIDQKKEQS